MPTRYCKWVTVSGVSGGCSNWPVPPKAVGVVLNDGQLPSLVINLAYQSRGYQLENVRVSTELMIELTERASMPRNGNLHSKYARFIFAAYV